MGQALRRVKPPATVRPAARNPVPVPAKDIPLASEINPSRATDSGAAEATLLRSSRATVAGSSRQNNEVKPQPPEPQMIIEPELNLGDWDRGDPKYSAMVQQVVGKITTRPGGKAEMGTAHVTAEFHRPKPMNRHTTAATGPDEVKVVASGTLNISGIREVFLLYQAHAEGRQEKPMDVTFLAQKFSVERELLERVLRFNSLPDTPRPDLSPQIPHGKAKVLT